MPALHEQRTAARAAATAALEEIHTFQIYLASDKFTGTDPRDGEAKDYIRTWEVREALRRIADHLHPITQESGRKPSR